MVVLRTKEKIYKMNTVLKWPCTVLNVLAVGKKGGSIPSTKIY